MATILNVGQGDDPGPLHPSTRLPRDVSTGVSGWPVHYLGLHPIGMVGYRPTRRPSMLLSV
jgi:hypothetical protein